MVLSKNVITTLTDTLLDPNAEPQQYEPAYSKLNAALLDSDKAVASAVASAICQTKKADAALVCFKQSPRRCLCIGEVYAASLMLLAKATKQVPAEVCKVFCDMLVSADIGWAADPSLRGKRKYFTDTIGLMGHAIQTACNYNLEVLPQKFVAAGAVRGLLKMADASSGFPLQDRAQAAYALCKLVHLDDGVQQVLEFHGLPILIGIAREISSKPTNNSSDPLSDMFESMLNGGRPEDFMLNTMQDSMLSITGDPFSTLIGMCVTQQGLPRFDVISALLAENGIRMLIDHISRPKTVFAALRDAIRTLSKIAIHAAASKKHLMPVFIQQITYDDFYRFIMYDKDTTWTRLTVEDQMQIIFLNAMGVLRWCMPFDELLTAKVLDISSPRNRNLVKRMITHADHYQAGAEIINYIASIPGGMAVLRAVGDRHILEYVLSPEMRSELAETQASYGVGKRCSYEPCSKPEPKSPKFAVCGSCRAVQYCSRECQRAHWKAHKHVCALTAQKKPTNTAVNASDVD